MTENEDEWTYEFFYFGSATYPPYEIWRSRGGDHQLQVELSDVTSIEDARVLWTYYVDEGRTNPLVIHSEITGGMYLSAWVSEANLVEDSVGWYERAKSSQPEGVPLGIPFRDKETWTWLED
jgi:hypothetical protein